jgi:hypothetical protein
MTTTEISCQCGAVHLELRGAPLTQFYCHCGDCRAVSGQPYNAVALFPAQAVTLTQGELGSLTYKTMPRRRCEQCGTILMGEPPGLEVRGVRGDLLPAHLFKPEYHIHCREAVQPMADGLPHYKQLPPQFGGSDERADW